MNYSIKIKSALCAMAAVTLAVSSCNKDNSVQSGATSTSTDESTATTITVAATQSTASTDSVYIMQACPRGTTRDSIAQSALLSAITTYLTTTYAGYTFKKAYAITTKAGTVAGYVAIVYYNDKPVGVLFDANGAFVATLEQRERGDLLGKGWHLGGRFEDRGGIRKDTIALSALPSAVTSYLSGNYSTDTLLKAFKNRDSSYLVISKNNGLYATVFDANGNFVKRIELPSKHELYQVREVAALLSAITSYLDTAYPNYTLKKAYSLSVNGTVKAYIVVIDANSTRYALEFDSLGTFVRVKTLF